MNSSEKAKLTASVRHIEKFSKSGLPINNFKVLGKADRKTTRIRTQATTKRYAFHSNAINNKIHYIIWVSDFRNTSINNEVLVSRDFL